MFNPDSKIILPSKVKPDPLEVPPGEEGETLQFFTTNRGIWVVIGRADGQRIKAFLETERVRKVVPWLAEKLPGME